MIDLLASLEPSSERTLRANVLSQGRRGRRCAPVPAAETSWHCPRA